MPKPALSFTINVSHFHLIMKTWYRGDKNTATTPSYVFLLSATQKEIRIQLSWHHLMLEQKSQNVMPILYEKDYWNQREKLLHLYLFIIFSLLSMSARQ
jgi:hypothetical protein